MGKPPSRLSLPEALSLALLPQNPNQRAQALREGKQAPEFVRLRETLGRRLLNAWPAAGDARLVTLGVSVRKDELPFLAPHFADEILAESATSNALRTTLDLPLQRLLERQVHRFVETQKRLGVDNAAALLVDTRDMGVRALVGSADFFEDPAGVNVRSSAPFLYCDAQGDFSLTARVDVDMLDAYDSGCVMVMVPSAAAAG